jgi:hypothetical protein
MDGPCDTYTLNQWYVDALEFLDRVIKKKALTIPSVIRAIVPRGTMQYGNGLSQVRTIFHPGRGDDAGLLDWTEIQVSRPASGDDPGFDACRYNSKMIEYGFEKITWKGHQTTRRTVDICLNDWLWRWEWEQQMKLIFSFLADVTLQNQENFAREALLKTAADNGNLYVMCGGAGDQHPLAVTYDPFSTTDMVITVAALQAMSALNWDWLDWWHQLLVLSCPEAALAVVDGMPQFGIAIHPKDFDQYLLSDPDVREDYRHVRPEVLVQGYGKLKSFRNWIIVNDIVSPRFNATSISGSNVTCTRVLPFTSEATNVNERTRPNHDYINGAIGSFMVLMKNMIEIDTPPTPPVSPGGGTNFPKVITPSGLFAWINHADRCENILQEKGFYFAKYQNFILPLENHENFIGGLYKRCVAVQVRSCEPCGADVGEGAINIVSAEETSEEGVLSVELASCLPCEVGAAVTVTQDDGETEVTGYVVDASEAGSATPTYRILFATAPDVANLGTSPNNATVECV